VKKGLAEQCLKYLEQWHDRFYLYGERPFCNLPAIASAKVQPFGAVLPEISTGNTTVLSQVQVQQEVDDGDKALLLLTLMGFSLSGKKTDNSVVLTPDYSGKRNEKANHRQENQDRPWVIWGCSIVFSSGKTFGPPFG